jgi:predicted metalloprotease with PDZ domain
MAWPARATITYQVSLAHPEQHIFHISMSIPDAQGGVSVQIPAWNALYQIRDFAHHVTNVRARVHPNDAGRPQTWLAVMKLDKQTWKIGPPAGEILGSVYVDYDIFWDEPGPFSSQLNGHHAFVNLADILFYVPGRRAEQSRVFFVALPEKWKIAVELPAGEAGNSFMAPSYDALVDAPVEIGPFEEFRFEESGPHYRVVVDGKNWEYKKLSDDLGRIVNYETSLMGGAPFKEYIFFFHIGAGNEVGGGGMEHANSTAIAAESDSSAVSVAAHEFFHAWNVKRIRPRTLEPADYTHEQYTRALWFAEGVTSTYGSYTLERSGIWNRERFYDDLAGELAELDSHPARLWQSVEQASLDTWLDKYPYYRRPEVSISYYNKGKILGELLDLEIRDAAGNHKSLDDVLRALNEQFAQKGRFYNDSADIRATAEQVCGCKLADFFSRYVSGTEEIPYADLLALAGLRLEKSTREFADFGFWSGRGPGNLLTVSEVDSGSNAEAAGLRQGDVLLELDGAAFPRNTVRWLGDHKPGDSVRLRIRRDEKEQEISFALARREERSYRIEDDGHAGEKQRRIREGWLRGTTD